MLPLLLKLFAVPALGEVRCRRARLVLGEQVGGPLKRKEPQQGTVCRGSWNAGLLRPGPALARSTTAHTLEGVAPHPGLAQLTLFA